MSVEMPAAYPAHNQNLCAQLEATANQPQAAFTVWHGLEPEIISKCAQDSSLREGIEAEGEVVAAPGLNCHGAENGCPTPSRQRPSGICPPGPPCPHFLEHSLHPLLTGIP